MGKKTRGRQKVDMKKIENEDQLQVTFSKRRNGLIKMANEMCVLTGAEIALIVFSPGNRVYPFGNPNLNKVIDRYENKNPQLFTNDDDVLSQACNAAKQLQLNSELAVLEKELLGLKKRGKLLDQLIEKKKNEGCTFEDLIKDLDKDKLEELLNSAKELDKDVSDDIDRMWAWNSSVPSIFDMFSSIEVAGSGSKDSAPRDPNEVGTAGVVQYAGPSRFNGDSEIIPGQSSANPIPEFPVIPSSDV